MMGINLDALRTIDDADVAGKRILLRVDLNVPVNGAAITDETRMMRVLPTILALCERGASVILLSHFGRPNGKRVNTLSLKPVADALRAMLHGTVVRFVDECAGLRAEAFVNELAAGQVAVLENLRFHPGEEENCSSFARALSTMGDVFVNEAFSTAHRAHASTDAITRQLPSFAGPSLMAEIDALRAALHRPDRPVAAVVGGAKISTKIPVLSNLATRVDTMIIAGAMANTFLYAMGHDVGASLCEPELASVANEILAEAKTQNCEILLPHDVIVAEEFCANASTKLCDVNEVCREDMILDVGPSTLTDFKLLLARCSTLLWNGPLGAFEVEPFGHGTFELARAAARLTRQGTLTTVAGGGDTVAALNAAGVTKDFTYVSTAGGAFLEWLEGKELPGVAALARQNVDQLARSA